MQIDQIPCHLLDDPEEWIGHPLMEDLLAEAYRYALQSPDPSTQCGALVYGRHGLFIAGDCNRFTHGSAVTPERLERPLKYDYIEHAERNAIYAATRLGKAPYLMVAPWSACTECARAIVQSGIRILIRHELASDRSPERWRESIEFADSLMWEAGVSIFRYEYPIGAVEPIRHCEEMWRP